MTLLIFFLSLYSSRLANDNNFLMKYSAFFIAYLSVSVVNLQLGVFCVVTHTISTHRSGSIDYKSSHDHLATRHDSPSRLSNKLYTRNRESNVRVTSSSERQQPNTTQVASRPSATGNLKVKLTLRTFRVSRIFVMKSQPDLGIVVVFALLSIC